MKWTQQPPEHPGYYWYRFGNIGVTKVIKRAGELQFEWPFDTEIRYVSLKTHKGFEWSDRRVRPPSDE